MVIPNAYSVCKLLSTGLPFFFFRSLPLGQFHGNFQFKKELIIVDLVSLGISIVDFSLSWDVLSHLRLCGVGNYCLSKLPRLSFDVYPWNPSSDKRVSNFEVLVHIMPALVLHALIHLVHPDYSHQHYPALKDVPNLDLLRRFWIPITIHTTWQGCYYLFNRRYRAKIVAGLRMTNFIRFRKIHRGTWIGKWVTQFPEPTQFLAFMGMQVLPCTHCQFKI